MWWARVGQIRRYRGVYYRHWEAGHGIVVWLLPGPPRALARLAPLAVVAAAHALGWLSAGTALLLAAAGALVLAGAFREVWLPEFAPGQGIGPEFCWQGRWRVEFEGVAGPRRRIWSPVTGPGPWDREARVVQVLQCRAA